MNEIVSVTNADLGRLPVEVRSRPESKRWRGNHLLAELAPAEFDLLAPYLSAVAFLPGTVLQQCGQQVEHAYFLESGLVSVFTVLPDGSKLETCSVGRKGAINLMAGLGSRRAFNQAIVQMPVSAARISIQRLAEMASSSGSIRDMITRYGESVFERTQTVLVCNSMHAIGQRLCRWLLQACDETGLAKLFITQATLGQMLGVRRTTVTLICKGLQEQGIIRVHRGSVVVQDVAALAAKACSCHPFMPASKDPQVGQPGCPGCGARMVLVSRVPHPQHGKPYEHRTFRCSSCAREQAEDGISQVYKGAN
jgi:CRP-like cAMP-binding protein